VEDGVARFPETATAVGVGLSATIPYVFENRTGARVYIQNCNGGFFIRLERLEGSDWIEAWVPAVPACQSAPMTVGVGEQRTLTLQVWGSLPGTNHYPQFDVAAPSGTYRIVWGAGTVGPSGSALPFDDRVSNEFLLSGP
jgi:hypothetical protein